MTDDFYQSLQRCIMLARQGVSLGECLARYPQYAAELEPLLLAATAPSEGYSNSRMSLSARTRVRQRALEHWDRIHRPERQRPRAASVFSLHWAAAMALVILAAVALIGGGSTVMAAQDSVPGASLYPVKELREEARLWLARSPEEKVAIYTNFVKERAEELTQLAGAEERGAALVAVGRLEEHVSAVDQLIHEGAPEGQSRKPPASAAIIRALENALAEPESVNIIIEETLEQAPEEAYPCLNYTLQAIQSARSQVSAALEAVGQDFPQSAAETRVGGVDLCPP